MRYSATAETAGHPVRDLPPMRHERASRFLRQALDAIRRRPPVLTAVLVVCIVSIWLRLEVAGQLPQLRLLTDGFSGRALVNGRWIVLATSTLLTRDAFMVISISVSLLVTLGTYEVLAGPLRALVLAIVAAVLGPVSVAAGLGALSVFGLGWASTSFGTVDIGASAIVAAASGAVAGIVRDRRLTLVLVAFIIGGLLVHHQLADWEHLLVLGPGYAMGRRLGQPARVRPVPHGLTLQLLVGLALLSVVLPAAARLLPAPRVFRTAAGQALSAPRALNLTYPTPSLGGTRRVLVLLPAGYDNTTTRYPVIELLHGDPGKPQDFFSLGNLASAATAPGVAPFIAVMPDGHGPRVWQSWYANIPSQSMGTAVSTDLRRWAASTLRTNGSWSYAGLSSGGFAAAYLPLIDPAPVHGACALSGRFNARVPVYAHGAPALRAAADADTHPRRAAAITFVGYGSTDSRAAVQADAYVAALRRVHRRVVVRTYPGTHHWTVWRPGFQDCFRVLVPTG